MAKSFKEYICAVFHWWWVMVIGIIGGGVTYALNIWSELNIPAWVWIALALAGLFVAQFLAFHKMRVCRDKLKEQLDDKAKNRRIREKLGGFLAKAHELSMKCRNEKEPPPKQEINDLANEMEIYIRENLDEAYIARINSSAGLPMGVSRIQSQEHRNADGLLRLWLARLNEFIAEFKD